MKPTEKKTGRGNGCPYYKKCGGCQLQNMDYEEQLSYKTGKEISILSRYGKILPIVRADDPNHYRCKVQAAFRNIGGRVQSGVFQSTSGQIVPIDACMIENETADRIVLFIRKLCQKLRVSPADRGGASGFLRHVLVRVGYFTGQYMVVLATTVEKFPQKDAFIAALTAEFPEIASVVQCVSSGKTDLVLGKEEIVLFGKPYVEDRLCGLTFRISARSFYQINPPMTEKLYRYAISILELTGRERLIDAYCGTGTIGLIAASSAKEVIGVESNPESVKNAVGNAEINGIENASFVTMDATAYLLKLAKAGEKIDALIMDPPRAGSTVKFMESAVKLAPEKIVYVSCNPDTLARDLYHFIKHGYKTRSIQPFDLFPHTGHVETVVLLTKLPQTKDDTK